MESTLGNLSPALVEALLEAARSADAYRRERSISASQRRFASLFRTQKTILIREMDKAVRAEYERRLDATMAEASIGSAVETALRKMEAKTVAQSEKAYQRALLDGVEMGYGTGSRVLGMSTSFELPHPDAVAWSKKHATERMRNVSDATRDDIKGIVTRGLEEGKSYSKVAREIKGKYSEYAVGVPQEHIRSRAELIAVTENAHAYEEGNRMFASDVAEIGLELEKSWKVVDSGCCDDCDTNAGEGWIGLDEAHFSGDQNPPAHPGCRCNEQYRRKHE